MLDQIEKRLPIKRINGLIDASFEEMHAEFSEGLSDKKSKALKFVLRYYRARFNALLGAYKESHGRLDVENNRHIFELLSSVRSCLRKNRISVEKLPSYIRGMGTQPHEEAQELMNLVQEKEEEMIMRPTLSVINELAQKQYRRVEATDFARNNEIRNRTDIAKEVYQLINIIRGLEPTELISRQWLDVNHPELFKNLSRLVSDNHNAPEDWSRVTSMLPKPLRSRCRFNDEELRGLNREFFQKMQEYRFLASSLGPEVLADVLVALLPDIKFKRALSVIPRYLGKIQPTYSMGSDDLRRLPRQILERPNVRSIIYVALRRKICEQLTEELDSQPIDPDDLKTKSYEQIEQEHAEKMMTRLTQIAKEHLKEEVGLHWELYLELIREFEYILNRGGNGMRTPSRLNGFVRGKGDRKIYRAPSLVQRILMNEMTKLGSDKEHEKEYQNLKGILMTLSMGKGKTLGSFMTYEKLIEGKLNAPSKMIYVCPDTTLSHEIAAQVEEHYRKGQAPSTFVFDAKVTPKMIEQGVLNDHEIIIIPYSMLSSFRELENNVGEKQNHKISNILARLGADLIVIDEPQNADKPTKPYTVAVRELVRGSDAPFVMLSGTPAPNGPQDLAPQFALARPDLFKDATAETDRQTGHNLEDLKGVTMKQLLSHADPIVPRAAFAHFNCCLESPQTQWEAAVREPEIHLGEEQMSAYQEILGIQDYPVSFKMGELYYTLMNPLKNNPLATENAFVDRSVEDLSKALFEKNEGSALITEGFRRQGILTPFLDPELAHIPTYVQQVKAGLEQKHGEGTVDFKVLHGDIKNRLTREYLLDWARFPEFDHTIKIYQFVRALFNCDQQMQSNPSAARRIGNVKARHMARFENYLAENLSEEQLQEFQQQNIAGKMRALVAAGSKNMRAFRNRLYQPKQQDVLDFLKDIEPPQKKRVLCSMEKIIREGINLFEINTMIKNGFGFRKDDDAQMVKRILREGTPAEIFMYMTPGLILEGIRDHKDYKKFLSDRMIYGGSLNPREVAYVESGDLSGDNKLHDDGFLLGSRISDKLYGDRARLFAINRAMEQKGEDLYRSFIELEGDDYAKIARKYWDGSESEMTNRVVSSVIQRVAETSGIQISKIADIGAGLRALDNTLGVSRPDISITSFDSNPHMLEEGDAISQVRKGSLYTSSESAVCGATDIKAPDSSFDAVNCSHLLQYLSCHQPNKSKNTHAERAKAIMEMNRILKPGGLLTITLPEDVCTEEQVRKFSSEMLQFGFTALPDFMGTVRSQRDEGKKPFSARILSFTKSVRIEKPDYNYTNLRLERKTQTAGGGTGIYNDQYKMFHDQFEITSLNKTKTPLHYLTASVEEHLKSDANEIQRKASIAREIIHKLREINGGSLNNLSEAIKNTLKENGIKLLSLPIRSRKKGDQQSRFMWIFSIEGNPEDAYPVDLDGITNEIIGDDAEGVAPDDDAEFDEAAGEDEWEEQIEDEVFPSEVSEAPQRVITETGLLIDSLPLGPVSDESLEKIQALEIECEYSDPLVIDFYGEKILSQRVEEGREDSVVILDVRDNTWSPVEDGKEDFFAARRSAQVAVLPRDEMISDKTLREIGLEKPDAVKALVIENPEKSIFAGGEDQVLTMVSAGEYLVYNPKMNTWNQVSRKDELADRIRRSRGDMNRKEFRSALQIHQDLTREELISAGMNVPPGITVIKTVPNEDDLRIVEIVGVRDNHYWVMGRRRWEQVTDADEIEYFRTQRGD